MDKKNRIWNDKLSTVIKGNGIYKLYFENYEGNCYIGKTTDKSCFNARLSAHKSFLWKIWNGISIKDSIKNYKNRLTQNEYKKLNAKNMYDYNQNIKNGKKKN